MTSSEDVSPDAAATGRASAPVLARPLWWQVPLHVGYMLLAAPRGLLCLALLVLALALDLPALALRLLRAAIVGLLFSAARAALWLLRFGVRFLWVGLIVALVWALQSVWWLCGTLALGIFRIVAAVVVDLIHPRTAWQRAVRSMRIERARVRARPATALGAWSAVAPLRRRGERIVAAWSGGLRRVRHTMILARWIVVPLVWWRLAEWERRHTMRWLNVSLPMFFAPAATPLDRAASRPQVPAASLVFLAAKIPLGMLALAACALGLASATQFGEHGNLGAAIVSVLAAISVLHLLALVSARVAYRAYSPSLAVRRLHAAEAQAAEARARAERAEVRRRDLVINASHELRTPTASILGHVESVLLALDAPDTPLPPEMLRSYLGIVQREAERLSALVDELLAAASAERAELQLVCGPVDSAAVIAEVYQALAPLARRERHVVLIHDVLPDLPLVRADRQRLTQVLLNLVRNAISYTPTGGIVSIALSRAPNNRLCIAVADTGSGIAHADLERIFERFYRADASRARASGGFGLGLAIARDLVEAMGGSITVDSVVGEGSCFNVILPIAEVAA